MTNLILVALFLGVAGVLIYIQYRLCNGENGKKLGLILPIISFIFSVLCVVSMIVFSAVKTTRTEEIDSYDEYGNPSGTEIIEFEEDYESGLIPSAIAILVITNIPTLIYMIEYAVITSGKNKSRIEAEEIEKTQIQDL